MGVTIYRSCYIRTRNISYYNGCLKDEIKNKGTSSPTGKKGKPLQ